jgi:hypothetical protein
MFGCVQLNDAEKVVEAEIAVECDNSIMNVEFTKLLIDVNKLKLADEVDVDESDSEEEVVCVDNLPAKDFIESIDVDDGEDEVMVVNDEDDAEIDVDDDEEDEETVDEEGGW